MKLLLALLPGWAWAAILAGLGALGAAGLWWHYSEVRTARQEGRADVQADWDAAERDRDRQANADALRRFNRAQEASTAHETERARLARALEANRHALRDSLRAPLTCPAGATVGDVVVPAASMQRLRHAAQAPAAGQRPDSPAAGKPGGAVR
jgi:hypothetical protein